MGARRRDGKEKCRKCGVRHPIDELDSKPELTPELKRIRAVHGALHMLNYAADRGINFTRLECRNCYGPGYSEI